MMLPVERGDDTFPVLPVEPAATLPVRPVALADTLPVLPVALAATLPVRPVELAGATLLDLPVDSGDCDLLPLRDASDALMLGNPFL